ncbi:DUF3108 domain-containing protein [Nannocystaceae bacterium ST9]
MRGRLSIVVVALTLGLTGAVVRADAAQPPEGDQTYITYQATEEARERTARDGGEQAARARQRKQRDASRIPRMHSPSLQVSEQPSHDPVVGWAAALDEPEFPDRRRRLPSTEVPPSYVHSLRVGERFVFDVYFAGNPAGLAEAGVYELQADPRGEPPQGSGKIRIEARAVTSGVVSLLSSMEDTMTTWVDAETGAPISSVNLIDRSGLGTSKYKKRTTTTEFEGRGYIRVIDTKDTKTTKLTRHVPRDTLDPMAAMAWVRALDLAEGERVSAHVLDGKVLLRLDVVGRGPAKLDPLPSVAVGLGVKPEDVRLLEGTLSWVDRHGVVQDDKRTYQFRAYTTQDERRLLLAIETDMWLGVLELVLNRYDPPVSSEPAASP